MAREIIVHLSNGTSLTVSKEHEQDLSDALGKTSGAVAVRDATGARNIVNVAHIVRVEMRS